MSSYPNVKRENGYYKVLGGKLSQRKSNHPYKNASGFGIRRSIYAAYILLFFVFMSPYFSVLSNDYSNKTLEYEKKLTIAIPVSLSILYILFYSTYSSATFFTDFQTIAKDQRGGMFQRAYMKTTDSIAGVLRNY